MSRFDEEPDGDPHGECAAEIHKLQSEIESLRAELAALQAEPAVEPVPMTDQEFTAWIESCGFVIEPHTAWTIKELVERHHNIKPKGE